MNHIGVDVDSQFLVCKARFGEQDLPIRQFDNNAVGHRQLIKWATARGASAHVCMEATGVYGACSRTEKNGMAQGFIKSPKWLDFLKSIYRKKYTHADTLLADLRKRHPITSNTPQTSRIGALPSTT